MVSSPVACPFRVVHLRECSLTANSLSFSPPAATARERRGRCGVAARMRVLVLGALCVVCANAADVDYAMKLQQTLGSASIAYKESNFDGTLSKLEQLQKTIAEWRATVVAKKAAGAVPVEPEKEPEPPAESVEFFVNQTHVPDKCKRKAEEGATMRVHYVGKLLTGA